MSAPKQPSSETERGSCGHPGFCAPKNDGQCDHINGHGTHQGYTYRCLLIAHGDSRHFHDRRPEARDWFRESTGVVPVIAEEQRELRERLATIEAEAADIRAKIV